MKKRKEGYKMMMKDAFASKQKNIQAEFQLPIYYTHTLKPFILILPLQVDHASFIPIITTIQ